MNHLKTYDTILILSHDKTNSDLITERLKKSGHDYLICEAESEKVLTEITTETNPVIAIWAINSFSDELQKALSKIKKLDSNVKIVIVSESYSKESEITAFRNGASAFIHKDEIDIRLDSTVNDIINSHFQRLKTDYQQKIESLNGGMVQGCARLLHDVNSPLSAIQNSFEMIEMNHEAAGKPLDSTLMILRSALVSSAQIVQKWHKFLYAQPVYNEEVNIFVALQHAISIVKPNSSKIEFSCQPESICSGSLIKFPNLMIKGNFFNVTQIFTYILQNAIEAVEELDEQTVEIIVNDNPNSIDINIADNGAGIPAELVTTIWKDFITDKGEDHPGLGLGVARYLLMLHAGSITYGKSDLPGASFKLSFRKR
jgi:K+-sensing histidine kinase KdpD